MLDNEMNRMNVTAIEGSQCKHMWLILYEDIFSIF